MRTPRRKAVEALPCRPPTGPARAVPGWLLTWILNGLAIFIKYLNNTCFLSLPIPPPQDLSIWQPMPCAEVPDTFRPHTFRLRDLLVRVQACRPQPALLVIRLSGAALSSGTARPLPAACPHGLPPCRRCPAPASAPWHGMPAEPECGQCMYARRLAWGLALAGGHWRWMRVVPCPLRNLPSSLPTPSEPPPHLQSRSTTPTPNPLPRPLPPHPPQHDTNPALTEAILTLGALLPPAARDAVAGFSFTCLPMQLHAVSRPCLCCPRCPCCCTR